MIISKKKFEEIIAQRIAEEQKKTWAEQQFERLGRELYSEVGRLETMIRSIEARVMERMEERKDEKTCDPSGR